MFCFSSIHYICKLLKIKLKYSNRIKSSKICTASNIYCLETFPFFNPISVHKYQLSHLGVELSDLEIKIGLKRNGLHKEIIFSRFPNDNGKEYGLKNQHMNMWSLKKGLAKNKS